MHISGGLHHGYFAVHHSFRSSGTRGNARRGWEWCYVLHVPAHRETERASSRCFARMVVTGSGWWLILFQVWLEAGGQVLYTLGVCFAVLYGLGSYNKFHTDCYRCVRGCRFLCKCCIEFCCMWVRLTTLIIIFWWVGAQWFLQRLPPFLFAAQCASICLSSHRMIGCVMHRFAFWGRIIISNEFVQIDRYLLSSVICIKITWGCPLLVSLPLNMATCWVLTIQRWIGTFAAQPYSNWGIIGNCRCRCLWYTWFLSAAFVIYTRPIFFIRTPYLPTCSSLRPSRPVIPTTAPS